MKSKVGSILLLISGILTSLAAIVVLVFAVAIPFMESVEGNKTFGTVFLVIIFIVLLTFSILKFWASKLMKDPVTTHKGGVIALVVGILNGGDLLAIIGGVLGITQGGEPEMVSQQAHLK